VIGAASIDIMWRLDLNYPDICGPSESDPAIHFRWSHEVLDFTSRSATLEDFNSDVPAETAELWVGTPYAAWIESRND
jgi:hypothetical protein